MRCQEDMGVAGKDNTTGLTHATKYEEFGSISCEKVASMTGSLGKFEYT